jgi:MATE family multidrug resistance protein
MQGRLLPVKEDKEDEEEFCPWRESRSLWQQTWPMLVAFGARYAMVTIDDIFVGHLTNAKDGLAAAALADMVCSVLTSPASAFNRVLSALCGQAFGAGRPELAATYLRMSLAFSALANVPGLVGFLYVGEILGFLGFSSSICGLASQYGKWSMLWPTPNIWYQCMRSYFNAQGNTRPAMYTSVAFIVIQALLDWVFVLNLGWGLMGAAIALSASRCLQFLLYWVCMFHKGAHRGLPWTRVRLRRYLDYVLPQIVTSVVRETVDQSNTLMLAQLGTISVSASSVASTVLNMWTGSLGPAINAGAGVRVGYYLGRGKWRHAKRTADMLLLYVLSVCLFGLGLLVALRTHISAAMTSDTDVQALYSQVMIPAAISASCALYTRLFTSGIMCAQGRNCLQTSLSLCFELPVFVGVMALGTFVFRWGLVEINYVLALANLIEMLAVVLVYIRSDWHPGDI